MRITGAPWCHVTALLLKAKYPHSVHCDGRLGQSRALVLKRDFLRLPPRTIGGSTTPCSNLNVGVSNESEGCLAGYAQVISRVSPLESFNTWGRTESLDIWTSFCRLEVRTRPLGSCSLGPVTRIDRTRQLDVPRSQIVDRRSSMCPGLIAFEQGWHSEELCGDSVPYSLAAINFD